MSAAIAAVRANPKAVARVLEHVVELLNAHPLGTRSFEIRQELAEELQSIGLFDADGTSETSDPSDEDIVADLARDDSDGGRRCSV